MPSVVEEIRGSGGRQWWLTGWREGLSLTQQARVAGNILGEAALWVVW